MNKVMNRLKDKAAELGANGVLLQGIDTQYTGSVNSGYVNATTYGNSAYATGVGYSAAQFSKVGRAIAIYVPAIAPGAAPVQPVNEPPGGQPVVAPLPKAAVPAASLAPSPSPAPAPAPSNSNWRKWGQKSD